MKAIALFALLFLLSFIAVSHNKRTTSLPVNNGYTRANISRLKYPDIPFALYNKVQLNGARLRLKTTIREKIISPLMAIGNDTESIDQYDTTGHFIATYGHSGPSFQFRLQYDSLGMISDVWCGAHNKYHEKIQLHFTAKYIYNASSLQLFQIWNHDPIDDGSYTFDGNFSDTSYYQFNKRGNLVSAEIHEPAFYHSFSDDQKQARKYLYNSEHQLVKATTVYLKKGRKKKLWDEVRYYYSAEQLDSSFGYFHTKLNNGLVEHDTREYYESNGLVKKQTQMNDSFEVGFRYSYY